MAESKIEWLVAPDGTPEEARDALCVLRLRVRELPDA